MDVPYDFANWFVECRAAIAGGCEYNSVVVLEIAWIYILRGG